MNLDNEQPRKKVGIAISGGWIRAMAAIGVIEIFEENNVEIDLVSGCSAGSGIAAFYAAGCLEEVRDRFKKGTWRDYWKVIFEPTVPKKGLLKGRRTREFFKEFVGEKTFSDLDKKLFITATDLKTLSPVILKEGNLVEALQASVTIPGMFVPIKHQEKILADGGNFSLIPSEVLYENGADYVIATDVSQSPNVFNRTVGRVKKRVGYEKRVNNKPVKEDHNIFHLIWRAANLSSTKIDNFYSTNYRYDILVKPDISDVKRWHVSKVTYLIQKGREAGLLALNQIKKDLDLS